MACLGAIELLGWPLDRIVTADVWATDTIPADLPSMVEFKAKADKIIAERWDIEVEHVRAKLTAQDMMYHVRRSGNRLTDGYPHRLYCSVCYKTYAKNVKWVEELDLPVNYCPECGAMMDGTEDGCACWEGRNEDEVSE